MLNGLNLLVNGHQTELPILEVPCTSPFMKLLPCSYGHLQVVMDGSMVKFSLYPPLHNESVKVSCQDEFGIHAYEMRSDPEFTISELKDIQPEIRGLFLEWLKGAQDRYRNSGDILGGLYGADDSGATDSARSKKQETDARDINNSKQEDENE